MYEVCARRCILLHFARSENGHAKTSSRPNSERPMDGRDRTTTMQSPSNEKGIAKDWQSKRFPDGWAKFSFVGDRCLGMKVCTKPCILLHFCANREYTRKDKQLAKKRATDGWAHFKPERMPKKQRMDKIAQAIKNERPMDGRDRATSEQPPSNRQAIAKPVRCEPPPPSKILRI